MLQGPNVLFYNGKTVGHGSKPIQTKGPVLTGSNHFITMYHFLHKFADLFHLDDRILLLPRYNDIL